MNHHHAIAVLKERAQRHYQEYVRLTGTKQHLLADEELKLYADINCSAQVLKELSPGGLAGTKN